ncbi:MAG: hypothetical protein ACREM1_19960 [Longimicrobiales bacterium]
MYSTCLFCNQSLGANEVLEPFPVGRRVAFDTAKGRLWVVCRKCERWNLSPLEERWEVVEACERLFRETRMRASTENIGLARLHEGLELVRIGQPLRPEFAAWRYGDQFGRRRKRAILYGVAAAAVGGTIVIGGTVAGIVSGGLLAQSGSFVNLFINARTLVKLKTGDGRVLKLKNPDLQTAGFVPPSALDDTWRVFIGKGNKAKVFRGEEAERFAGRMVPRMNRMGGNAAAVQEAVKRLEESGGPESFLRSSVVDPRVGFSAADRRRAATTHVRARGPDGQPVLRVAKLPTPLRLAVEMALHEEQERRTLEGELQALEIAWQEAEQIAAISDDLLLPANAETFLDQHRPERPAAKD